MSRWEAVKLITAWELRRFLRWGELLLSVFIIAALGVGGAFAVELFTGGEENAIELAVTGVEALPDSERFTFSYFSDADSAAAALADGEVDGVLEASDLEAPLLTLEREAVWTPELSEFLVQATLDDRLARTGVDEATLTALLEPVDLQVELTEGSVLSGTLVIVIIAGTMLFAVFIGTGLLFTTITGEKTQRITEQIVSAVSPQAWIDGKVLGTGLYVLVNLLSILVGLTIAVIVNMLRAEGRLPPLPPLELNPALIIPTLLFGLLGGALYFLFFAAIAATIDDPNSSARGGLIMLPPSLIGLSFLGLIGSVDNVLFRVLSYVPLTSPTAMPIRLLLGDAGWFEALISLVLLIVSVAGMRWIAGRIFALGIMMTGKEPSLREMLHWLRRV